MEIINKNLSKDKFEKKGLDLLDIAKNSYSDLLSNEVLCEGVSVNRNKRLRKLLLTIIRNIIK